MQQYPVSKPNFSQGRRINELELELDHDFLTVTVSNFCVTTLNVFFLYLEAEKCNWTSDIKLSLSYGKHLLCLQGNKLYLMF